MEETEKKATAPKKAVKKTTKAAAAAPPVAAKAKKTPVAAKPKATPTKKTVSRAAKTKISHEAIAKLAHRYWAERGGQHGHDAEDWFRAEQELLGKAS